ncbi:MAG: M55 family metallopeptidase [Anaerolineaceae bacterium]|nr:M55 family metallopeptidase [Anaerolineaceae bacterium]
MNKRILISADFEGVSGIVGPRQCIPSSGDAFQTARGLWMGEINAAVEGALDGGADEVVVNEAHAQMNYLDPERLHPRASFISGYVKTDNQVEGLQNGAAGVIYMGHARAGTRDGNLAHTYMLRELIEIRLNGEPIGEFGLNALWAAYHRTPVLLAVGDDKLAKEAQVLLPDIETVVVKTGLSQFSAHCLPVGQAREMIRAAAKSAVEKCAQRKALKIPSFLVMEIDFTLPEAARLCAFVPGVERIGGRTVLFRSNDYRQLQQLRVVCTNLALAVTNAHF